MHLSIGPGAGLAQAGQEEFPIVTVAKDYFPIIPATHHVVNRSRVLNTQFANHEVTLQECQLMSLTLTGLARTSTEVGRWVSLAPDTN
jgi:hypothetical protein